MIGYGAAAVARMTLNLYAAQAIKPVQAKAPTDPTSPTMNDRYALYRDSYLQATGRAWSRDKFMARAWRWTFYGDATGYVAFRVDGSGARKLVCAAGDHRAVMAGLMRLADEGLPVWGTVSERLLTPAKRYGLIAPHEHSRGGPAVAFVIKCIPVREFGEHPSVMEDGRLQMGGDTKCFVANEAFLERCIERANVSNAKAANTLRGIVGR